MKKALITGITGFTGQYLAACLRQSGYEVFGTTYNPKQVDEHTFYLDLCHLDQTKALVNRIQPEVVAHLAAISFVGHDSASEIYQTNLIGSYYLLSALSELKNPPKSILLASSSNIYGTSPDQPITEKTAPCPVNDYAISKLAMEQMASLWFDKLPIFIVRPFNYIGIGQPSQFLIPKIIQHFQRKDTTIELGNLDIERDFSDVRQVAVIYQQLIELAPAGKVINVCSGKTTALKDILNTMSIISNHSIQVTINPKFIREKDVKSLCGSNQNLKQMIGVVPKFDLFETLKWIYEKPPL